MVFTTGRHWWILGSGRSSWQLGIEIWGEAGDSLFLLHFEICKILHPYLDHLRSHLWILWTLNKNQGGTLRWSSFPFVFWTVWHLEHLEVAGRCNVLRMNQRQSWMTCIPWCPTSLDVVPCLWTNVTKRWQWEFFFWRGGRGRNAWNARFCKIWHAGFVLWLPQRLRHGMWSQSALWLHLSSWATSPEGCLKGLVFIWFPLNPSTGEV